MVADVAAHDAELSLILTVLQHCLLVKLLAAQPKQGPAHMTHQSDLCMVASKCSYNHFISEKYKAVQSFKLHFLQYSSLVQLHTSASDCKHVGNIPGNHFVKAFSALNDVSSKKKHHPFNADFSLGNRQKSAGARSAEYRGCSSVVILFFDKKFLTKTNRCPGALL